ncbi:MAG: 30S ribosomal protein S20 [Nitrospiraceae bacterium]|nr:30S ribosomal protein S20 [Nitrospiraceae bacterium]
MPAKAVKKKNLSTLKRVRQSEKQNLRNTAVRSKIKTISKKVEEAAAKKNKEQAEKLLREATKTIQSAVSKGIVHKNTAARKISRLAKLAKAVA